MKLKSKLKLPLVQCSALLLSMFLISSCAFLNEEDKEEEQEDRFAFLKEERENEGKLEHTNPESIEKEQVEVTQPVANEEQLKKLDSLGSAGSKATVPNREKSNAFYEDFIIFNADEEIEVSLTFNSAPILDVLPAFADILGFNFVADSNLKSVVTLNLNSTMTYRELWNTFDRMLFLSGAGVKVEGSLLRIMLLSKIAQQPESKLKEEILYYPIKNVTVKEVATQLKTFMGENSSAVELTTPNAIMLSDTPENIAKLRQILDVIDQNARSNWPRAVVPCYNILPSVLVEELQTVLGVLGFSVKSITDTSTTQGAVQMFGIDRLQLVVISAATQEGIGEIKNWIEVLDSADSLDREQVFVYKARYGKVDQLAQALAVIYNTQGSTLTIDTSTGDSSVSNVSFSASSTSTTTTVGEITTSTETHQAASLFDTPVRVFADGALNRLVIRTTPRTYASMKALLNRLDVVPAQVLLQVLVVEVTLTETTQFGLELSAQNTGGSLNAAGSTNYSMNTSDSTAEGFSFLLADPSNPENTFGYIQALAGSTTVKIVSSPQVLVSSHSEARIQVGSSIPVITGAITDSSSSGSLTQTYEYEDTGIILTITPQITSTDLISLEISQVLSDAITNTTSSTIDSPELTVREIETSMTIANGKTMVMGGLIQEKKNDQLWTLPFISDIPFLRRLLGSTDAEVERTEILVLVTGHIVNERSRVEDLIKRYNDALQYINEVDKATGEDAKSRIGANKLDHSEFWK